MTHAVGDFGFCQATIYRQGEYAFFPCGNPGVYIEEKYEMQQPGYFSTRIRCVCAECGSESTYCCIKCKVILHEWSPKHSEFDCNSSIVKHVMNS